MKAKRKKVLSAAIASALVAAQMVMPVMAADGGEFDVDVTTKNPVIRVVVPTTLEIAVDQFEMADAGTQIMSDDFTMENKSEVPVRVEVTSTFTVDSNVTLAATKEGAQKADDAQAWLAVAAQTDGDSYDDPDTTDTEVIGDMTEASFNVTTVAEDDDGDNTAKQTFYLKVPDDITKKAYGLLVPSAKGENEGVNYAQFYELTEIASQPTNDATLQAEVDANDVYVVVTTDKDATSTSDTTTTVKKIAKETTVAGSADAWATGNTYYTAANTVTVKDDLAANGHYVFAEVSETTATGGKAAFRYIGKLAESKVTWSDTDISRVHVKYDIYGVTATKYGEEVGNCVNGFYKEATATVEEVNGVKVTNGSGSTVYSTGAAAATILQSSQVQYVLDSATATKVKTNNLTVTKINIDGTDYTPAPQTNANADTNADGKIYGVTGFTANTISSIKVYYGKGLVVKYTFN